MRKQGCDFRVLEVLKLRDNVITLFSSLHPLDKTLQPVTAQAKMINALGKHSGEKQSVIANMFSHLAFAVE